MKQIVKVLYKGKEEVAVIVEDSGELVIAFEDGRREVVDAASQLEDGTEVVLLKCSRCQKYHLGECLRR